MAFSRAAPSFAAGVIGFPVALTASYAEPSSAVPFMQAVFFEFERGAQTITINGQELIALVSCGVGAVGVAVGAIRLLLKK